MSNLQMWSMILGVLMPPLVAIVQQPRWSRFVRSVVMVVSSIIVGAGTAYFENHQDFDGKDFVQSTLVVIVAAIAAYHGFWKPTGIAPSVERSTSVP